jgi:hypothetical protein
VITYIDRRGHFVVPPRFEAVDDFSHGLTAVKENGKWGYLDAQGHMAIPAIFDSVRNFAANGLAAFEKDGKKGYVDRAGKIAFTHQFDNAWDFSANNRARVMREISGEMRFGFIDEKGKIVIPVEFFDINDGLVGSFAANGLAPVGGENGKVGYIDKEGKVVIPFDFDYAEDFAENGLAVAEKDGKYGYINEEGCFVIAPQFAVAFNFCPSGLAIVIRHAEDLCERWGIITDYCVSPARKPARETVLLYPGDAFRRGEGLPCRSFLAWLHLSCRAVPAPRFHPGWAPGLS